MKTKLKAWLWTGVLVIAGGAFALSISRASEVETKHENLPLTATTGMNTNGPPAATQVLAQPTAAVPPTINVNTPGLAEIIKMAQSHVDDKVILAYIDNSKVIYKPTAAEILYMHDLGIAPGLITAMFDHGQKMEPQIAGEGASGANSETTSNLPESPSAAPGLKPSNVTSAPAAESPITTFYAPAAPPVPQTAAIAPAQMAPSSTVDGNFYNDLSPYGTWMDIPDYGWCWQPTIETVDSGWQPYGDGGHWLDTDNGWYWDSDYSWGCIPFHYGRWFQDEPCGWLWQPDNVWGPAWVDWRTYGDYCGWAPLPPGACFQGGQFWWHNQAVGFDCGFGLPASCFTFVDRRHFFDARLHDHFIHEREVNGFFDHSQVHNHYFVGPHNTLINEGISRSTIPGASRSEVRKVAIRDSVTAAGRLVPPDRPQKVGNQWVIYRPALAAAPPINPASRTGIRNTTGLARPSLERGYASGNQRPLPLNGQGVAHSLAESHRMTQSVPEPVAHPAQPNRIVVTHTLEHGIPVTTLSSVANPGRIEQERSLGLSLHTPVGAAPMPANKFANAASTHINPTPETWLRAESRLRTPFPSSVIGRPGVSITGPVQAGRPLPSRMTINPSPLVILPHPVASVPARTYSPPYSVARVPAQPAWRSSDNYSASQERAYGWNSTPSYSAPIQRFSQPPSYPSYSAPLAHTYAPSTPTYHFQAERPSMPSYQSYRSSTPAMAPSRSFYSTPRSMTSRPSSGGMGMSTSHHR